MRSTRLAVLVLAAAVLGSGCDGARPIEPAAGAAERCSACHGFPPPPFVMTGTAHPASTACSLCHATSVDANAAIIAGGAHRNGVVDVTIHPVPYVADHTTPALADLNACKTCHGADFSGGESGVSCTSCHAAMQPAGFPDWQTNCTFCHGTRTPGWTDTATSLRLAAPPRGSHGETLTTQPAVGAHAKHLGTGSTVSDGVACAECHVKPADLAHLDGVGTVTFGALATQGGLSPAYAAGSCSATYCHGSAALGGANPTPAWTGTAACGDCHGSPPPTAGHALAVHSAQSCFKCHALVATDTPLPGVQNVAAALSLHVNGAKDVSLSVSGTWDGATKTCSSVGCHAPGGAVTRPW